MQNNNVSAIDVKNSGNVEASNIAWLDSGEDVVAALRQIQGDDHRTVIGFEWDAVNNKFGVIVK